MASNHTAHFGLNQWAATDPVLREDFNADNQKIEAAMGGMAKIAMGNYVGTGVYGTGNENTLTFDFKPKLLVIQSESSSQFLQYGYSWNWCLAIQGTQKMYTYSSSSDSRDFKSCTFSWDENTVTWQCTYTSSAQFNLSGSKYYYLALG